jgi:hypothetical protein
VTSLYDGKARTRFLRRFTSSANIFLKINFRLDLAKSLFGERENSVEQIIETKGPYPINSFDFSKEKESKSEG